MTQRRTPPRGSAAMGPAVRRCVRRALRRLEAAGGVMAPADPKSAPTGLLGRLAWIEPQPDHMDLSTIPDPYLGEADDVEPKSLAWWSAQLQVLTAHSETLERQQRQPAHERLTMSKAPAKSHTPAAPAVEAAAAAVVAAPAAAAHQYKFAIEDNIPLPQKRTGPKGETAYPYKVLGIGQSFFVPSSDKMKEPWKTLTSMSSRISRELHPKKFTTAREKNTDGIDGVRIWRIADSTEALAPPKTINRKAKGEKARLAAEAAAGDTSQRQHPAPDFETPNPPPPPPAPPAPPAA